MLIQKNISLKNYTTFKIGGLAKYFVEVKDIDEAKEAVSFAKERKLPIFILGGGSNVLISDQGFNGLVIKISFTDFMVDNTKVTAGTGWNLNELIKKCWQYNLVGLENLSGVYGTLGGAIRGNAGAFGSEIAEFVESVEVIELCQKENQISRRKINLTKYECNFSYRDSVFKKNKNYVIWSAVLNLKAGKINSAKKQAVEIIKMRGADKNLLPSAGCVFKNVKDKKFNEFVKKNPKVKLSQNFYERQSLPAAWLIEKLNPKNFCLGGAKISGTHANFIINANQATAKDVVALINLIKNKVKERFKIDLQEEIQYVGF